MTRENEEQRPISQTICGALQKEPNCKCLVLSVLIYGCLAAVTWCRCANVTKVAFMGMLYLVYLVECYHSPIRIDLLHSENQDSVLSKLSQLKSAQPTIWWKAISYHYVRRKRQITRYRNGDNYTTTQVYYERINTHAATSFYYYDYCGVKDISKELVLDPKIPITKINLTKGFAFSNMRSATEFEEARSRFFAEQELRDDYMEMREGLDLGYNPNTTLVAVLGNPWFTNRYLYWCLSALLLSWPLRVIIEYKTQYADYQVTKLFGINYDTPIGSEPIRASISQLTISQPGSYMLAPSYSEALLMDPAPSDRRLVDPQETSAAEIVPSYSEALLYERAENGIVSNEQARFNDENPSSQQELSSRGCPCSCHTNGSTFEANDFSDNTRMHEDGAQSAEITDRSSLIETTEFSTSPCANLAQLEAGRCGSCGRFSVEAQLENHQLPENEFGGLATGNSVIEVSEIRVDRMNGAIPRDMSEPNLRSQTASLQANTEFLRLNGQSLGNILENDQEVETDDRIRICERKIDSRAMKGRFRLSLSSLDESNCGPGGLVDSSKGAIPKRTVLRSRVIANPMSNETTDRLPSSKTYFCLKSILKQNKRRYTLITARELQNYSDREDTDQEGHVDTRSSYHEGCAPSGESTSSSTYGERFNFFSRSRESLDGILGRKKKLTEPEDKNETACGSAKRENTRTLIFASPIQEICPGDPFGGKDVVQTRREDTSPTTEESSSHTVLTHLGRSLAYDRKSSRRRYQESRKHRYTISPSTFADSLDRQYSYPFSASTDAVDSANRAESSSRVYKHGISFPPYEGSTSNHNETIESTFDRVPSCVVPMGPGRATELTRSLTERRTKPVRNETGLRRSFTGRVEDYRTDNGKRTNLNMETSL